MNPVIFLGAAALLLFSGKKRSALKRTIHCPALSPGSGHIAGYDYIEFATGGASLTDRLPIVFCFHSLGTRPEGLVKYLEDIGVRARVVMPRGNRKFGSGPAWWTLRSKTEDQEALANDMSSEAKSMSVFIEEVNHCLIGVGRPIVTGHSQGGMMTYAVAAESPTLIRAAIPVSGWLPVPLWPKSLPPTWAVHGANDRTVNFDRTADFLQRAKGSGLPVELHPIKGKGHGLGGDLTSTWIGLVERAVAEI